MKIIGIVCTNFNRSIGWRNSNDLIYHIPNELKSFKSITTESTNDMPNIVLMGRNTWSSLPKQPLPDRHNCIITSDPIFYKKMYSREDNVAFYQSIPDFLNYLKEYHYLYNNVFVMGGYSIYDFFLKRNLLDYLYDTSIDTPNSMGDLFFPEYNNINYTLESHREFNNVPAINKHDNSEILLNYSNNVYINNLSETYKILTHI